MPQNFVISFGGTGARCMEAILYLAAAGSIRTPLQLLIVDPDETNGNVAETLKQLRRYQSIQKSVISPTTNGPPPFFSTPVNEGLAASSFMWSNPQPNQEFQTLIQYASQTSAEKGLLDLLYDESDLALTFEKGYVGRAHIGSLDLLRNLQAQIEWAAKDDVPKDSNKTEALLLFFKALRAATQQPGGARLLVIGSIFGGTGASGLPAIPPLLGEVLLSGLDSKLKLGCVQVAPYFTFPPGHEEDPDSALHPLATQAALFHYALTDTGYDRVYLVGAPTRVESNTENVPGGDSQKNKAHYVEIAAGLAAAHFFSNPPDADQPEVIACGSEGVSWDELPARTLTNIRKNFVSLATFCALHARFLSSDLEQGRHIGSKWHQDLTHSSTRRLGGQEPELRALTEFAVRFLKWAEEIRRVPNVQLLTVGDSADEGALSAMTLGGKSAANPYHRLISSMDRLPKLEQHTGIGWYVDGLSRSAFEYCADNYASWWH
jgi:hypothetical protein